jgi:hypothetical protein
MIKYSTNPNSVKDLNGTSMNKGEKKSLSGEK